MGIKYKCKKCGKIIEFPDTPNFDTNYWEQLAHMIYTQAANTFTCFDCDEKRYRKETVEKERFIKA